MRIIFLKSCDTCKKALKALASQSPDLHEIRADGLDRADVSRWLDSVGAEALINRRSTTWRNMDEAARDRDPLDLIMDNPTVMKRPVIEHEGAVYVGWNAATEKALGVS